MQSMMKLLRTAAGAVALAMVGIGAAHAADLGGGGSLKDGAAEAPAKRPCTLTANVALTSQYVFRGFSQTGENPAIQGGMDVDCGGRFYAGFWGSNLDFGGRDRGDGVLKDVANIEIDWYAGLKHSWDRFDFDLGLIYYSYPGAFDARRSYDLVRELDYLELKFGTRFKARNDLVLFSTLFYSPEYTNETGPVFTWENGFEFTLPKMSHISPSITALLGWQAGEDNRYKLLVGNGRDDYLYWNAGITFGFAEKFSLDLRYWDTNISNNAASRPFGSNNFCDGKATGGVFQCDERFVATLKATW
jgi:uncharacterized protein (TIGR02001 family)